MLNNEKTVEFLEWAIEKRPQQFFRSFFAIKTLTVDAFSEKILESAARTGNAKILRFFIDCGLEGRYFTGLGGGRYLQLSLSSTTRTDVSHLLLDNGADANPPLCEGMYEYPPLHMAAIEGHVEIIIRLLEAGAKVDTKVGDDTALSYAVPGGNADMVRLLLQAGADVDDGKIDDFGILDWAYLHKKSTYRMLLPTSRKAKITLTISGILSAAERGKQALSQYLDGKSGETLERRKMVLEKSLYFAICEEQSPDAISVLLEFRVDPNTETVGESQTPLQIAAGNYDIDLAECLLNAGARIEPNVLAAAAWSEDGFDTLNFFIEQGADAVAFGGEALQRAVCGNNLGGIKLLLSSGANIKNSGFHKDGYTLLATAARYAEIKTVKYLLDNGAMVNAPPRFNTEITALQAGAAAGRLKMMKFLLDVGADVNAEPSSYNGTTAL